MNPDQKTKRRSGPIPSSAKDARRMMLAHEARQRWMG